MSREERMNQGRRRALLALLGLAALATWGTPREALAFPDKPIRVIVPTAAGGSISAGRRFRSSNVISPA